MFKLALLLFLSAQPLFPQQAFADHCAGCHGADARGTAKGPGLALNPRVAEQSTGQLRAYLERGNISAGMPSFSDLPDNDLASLVKYLRRLNVETIVGPVTSTEPTRKITWGAPQPGDWITYNGNDSANRYSPLKQISTANVSSLKLKRVFPISSFGIETTPLAADGVLYVTDPNQVFALNAKTGELKWHYQFTPHDVEDRDATEPNVLVDSVYNGKPSKLLLHADRNGFFYVLDRTDGKVLLAKPFLRRVDWASSIGADCRPVVTDLHGCPSDAANWDSTAFSPETRLYYFLALEECVGQPTGYPHQTGQRFLRAINIDTGEIAWEVPQPGLARAKTWSGVLATAGGLIFYGQPNGGFAATNQRTGKSLWQFPTNVRMKASPMTFNVDGNQYIAVAAGPNILCFGL